MVTCHFTYVLRAVYGDLCKLLCSLASQSCAALVWPPLADLAATHTPKTTTPQGSPLASVYTTMQMLLRFMLYGRLAVQDLRYITSNLNTLHWDYVELLQAGSRRQQEQAMWGPVPECWMLEFQQSPHSVLLLQMRTLPGAVRRIGWMTNS